MPRKDPPHQPTARLREGTTIVDYSSNKKIIAAFGGDMKEVRKDYSRLRSILRKRLDRMESLGETENAFYRVYKDRDVMLPSARGLSDNALLNAMQSVAHGIGGGYQSSVTAIREKRTENLTAFRLEAEAAGDKEVSDFLAKGPTPKQLGQIGRMMNMIKKTIGILVDSDKTYQRALKLYVANRKTSLLTLATQVINDLGLRPDNADIGEDYDPLAAMKERFTSKGTERISWKKAHEKRGT